MLQIIVLEDTKEYISYAPKEETKEQDRHPFDLLVCQHRFRNMLLDLFKLCFIRVTFTSFEIMAMLKLKTFFPFECR